MKPSTRSHIMLFFTALIWGCAFAAQTAGADVLGPLSFNGIRMGLASLAMIPVMIINNRTQAKRGSADRVHTGFGVPFRELTASQRKTILLGGLACGAMLTLGSITQQLGITFGASTGKAGFVSALYIIIVPVLYHLFGKKVHAVLWLAVVLSLIGLYLLCVRDGLGFDLAVVMLIADAFCYSGHILVVDRIAPHTDGIKLNFIQTAVTSIFCLSLALPLERPSIQQILQCAIPLLYAGFMSGGIAYTLQIVGQKHADPTTASLLMSLESVFSVLAGWLIIGDVLSTRELIGCCIMFIGILIATLSGKEDKPEFNA